MRAAGLPLQRQSARKRPKQGRPRSGSPGPVSIPSLATRSDRLKDEVRLQARFLCAPHHRSQEDGFEFTTVIGEVTMRLAKEGNNLRHLKTERPVLVGERGSMALRLALLPFNRVRPDLDALAGKGSPVACAAHRATHPEAALADPIHDRRALAVVVRSAPHRIGRCEALCAGGQQQSGSPGCQDEAASGEEVATIEYDGGHVNSSWRACSASAQGYNNRGDAPSGGEERDRSQ